MDPLDTNELSQEDELFCQNKLFRQNKLQDRRSSLGRTSSLDRKGLIKRYEAATSEQAVSVTDLYGVRCACAHFLSLI